MVRILGWCLVIYLAILAFNMFLGVIVTQQVKKASTTILKHATKALKRSTSYTKEEIDEIITKTQGIVFRMILRSEKDSTFLVFQITPIVHIVTLIILIAMSIDLALTDERYYKLIVEQHFA